MKEFKNINDFSIFFDKIYRYLHFSNKNAHSLDLDKPILEQIFDYIDVNDKLKNLKKIWRKKLE